MTRVIQVDDSVEWADHAGVFFVIGFSTPDLAEVRRRAVAHAAHLLAPLAALRLLNEDDAIRRLIREGGKDQAPCGGSLPMTSGRPTQTTFKRSWRRATSASACDSAVSLNEQ
jgi:hypothetical protein